MYQPLNKTKKRTNVSKTNDTQLKTHRNLLWFGAIYTLVLHHWL